MRPWIIACGLFAAFAFVAACTAETGPGSRPFRPDLPQFDHAGHLARGVDCSDCHGGEEQAWSAMPTLETCNQCHEELDADKPPEKRATHSFDAQGAGKWSHASKLGAEVKFDHKHHGTVVSGDCAACHDAVAKSTYVAADARMSMAACMECHATRAPEKNECATCHKEIRADRAPPSHRGNWRRAHGKLAAFGELDPLPADCGMCHKPADCDTCHKNEPPQNHTNHFRLRGHAASASLDRDGCTVCHTTDSCVQCHQTTKPRNHTGAWGAPFDRHCDSCHLPATGFDDQGCNVCHAGAPSHASSPPRPLNAPHLTTNPDDCRACHTPAPHPDNGQSCLLCHQ
jgi:hypothetical protein